MLWGGSGVRRGRKQQEDHGGAKGVLASRLDGQLNDIQSVEWTTTGQQKQASHRLHH